MHFVHISIFTLQHYITLRSLNNCLKISFGCLFGKTPCYQTHVSMSKSWYGKLNRWLSLQLFATVRLLVQSAFGALHHINKIGQSLLLVHRDITEVTTDSLSQLGLV